MRKLLQEVHDVRPRSVPRKDTASFSKRLEDSHRVDFRTLLRLLSRSMREEDSDLRQPAKI